MRVLIMVMLLFVSAFSLDADQVKLLNTVYYEGKKYKAHDGFSFEKTLCAIYITESSAGRAVIGDKYTETGILKTLYESSIGPGQVRLETALVVLNKFPYLQKKFGVKSFPVVYYYRIIKLIKLKRAYTSELSILRTKMYSKILTKDEYYHLIKKIKVVSRKIGQINRKLLIYRVYTHRANRIINKLLADLRFSVAISANYLTYNYETAKRRRYWKPYLKAISRYNGGWLNYTYVRRVLKHLKLVNKLIKKGVIHD